MISEHTSRIVTSMTTSSLVHRLPASLLSLEQHHDRKDYYLKEEKVSQVMLLNWHSCFEETMVHSDWRYLLDR